MSFEVTVLGHQGWSVATETTHLLIDPLLTRGFGHGGHAGVVYPPRRFDLARMPPVHAVVLTHEHDDHFDIASLSRVDRRVPVHLSARSSSAAHACLANMGFEVRPLHAGTTVEVGDLRYRSVAADHVTRSQGDEWDVFPFVIRQRGHEGWMLSSVDVSMPTDSLAQRFDALVGPGPGLCVLANNTTSAHAFDATPGRERDGAPDDDTALLARVLARRLDALAAAGCAPQGVVLSGGGWAYEDDRAWLNAQVFPVDPEALAVAVETQQTHRQPAAWIAAPTPGARFTVGARRAGEPAQVVRHTESSVFLRTPPRSDWPDRTPAPAATLETYVPACGEDTLAAPQRRVLLEELRDVARYLYGTSLFRQLHSLPRNDGRDVAFRLLDARGSWTAAYAPQSCMFREVHCEDTIATYRGGWECWATDLHGVLTGRLAPSAMCYAGRLRTWNHDPSALRVSQHLLWMAAHPLRRPEASAALYARLAAHNAHVPVDVRAPG